MFKPGALHGGIVLCYTDITYLWRGAEVRTVKHLDLSGLDFGQIQAFLTVAATRNFTKAAELLHLSQPVVSKRVAALENQLGFQLFIRWRRTVRLTPAGQVLYSAWGDLTSLILEPINKANACQLGYTRHLTVAYCASAYPYQIGELFQQEHPDVNLSFVRAQYPEIVSKLISGEVDVAFYGVFGKRDFSYPPFRFQVLKTFPLVVAMLPANPLSQKKVLKVADLRGQDFIMLSPMVAPAWLSFMTELCMRNRFTPQVSLYVEDTASLVMNLRNDHSVFFTDRHCTVVDTKRIDLSFVDLPEAEAGTLVAWNEEFETDLIRAFVEKSAEYWAKIE